MKLIKESGGYDLDPCVDPKSVEALKLLACDDLVALQIENEDAINSLYSIGDIVIVPVSLEKYRELEDELNSLVKKVDDTLDVAVEKMIEAYNTMGIEMNAEELKLQMLQQVTEYGSSGKVLNEQLEIVDRAYDYIFESEEDFEDENYEEDEEDDFENEDYDFE